MENNKIFAIKPINISKIHWKAQAIVHFFLSLPIAALSVYSWGISTSVILSVVLVYLCLYFFIYFPIYFVLPYILFYRVRNEIDLLNSGKELSDKDLSKLISHLVNLPLPSAILIAIIEMSAFFLGSFLWITGVIPELLPLIHIVLLESIILGIIVAINISFVNLVMLETYFGTLIEKIILLYPNVFNLDIKIKHISMYVKIFFLILLTTIAGEISIILFFTTYILSSEREKIFEHAIIILLVIGINILYTFILAPIVANNLITPMRKLVSWIKEISRGNMSSRIRLITNDEMSDLIYGSNNMIERLDKTTINLKTSMESLEKDRKIIESERNKLSTVLTGVVDGVIALDKDKKVVLMNKAAEQISGWSYAIVKGTNIDQVFHITGKDQTEINSASYFPKLETSGSISLNDIKLTTKEGNIKYIGLTCSTINGDFQEGTTYIITFHDSTVEHELSKLKLDFVSMAAHELRTPITIIRGYLEVFLLENAPKLDNHQSQMMNRINYAARQLGTLIENLLMVSKIDRGAMQLDVEIIDWTRLIKETVEGMKYIAKEKNINLEYSIPENFTATIEGDKVRISEITGNLISNAINYTNSGGKVVVKVEENQDEVITNIEDTGMGIPEKEIPHLFTKFFRASGQLQAGSKGTGLGLYLTKTIVDMHNGRIWVKSEVNKGSIFSFSLPKKFKKSA